MNFEVLKQNNLKRNIIIGGCVVLVISAVILNFSSARYRSTASVPIVNSEVNYVRPDLNVVAIVVDGESTNTMPEGNYKLLDTSYCTVNGKNANVTLSWDQENNALSVTPFTTRGTKCYLYFETATTKTVNTALGNIEVKLDTPDFNKMAQADCGTITMCEETNGIYESVDDDGTTYYFRGDVDNNWAYFAGFYWQIIRINGDGSIRLIYNGSTTDRTSDDTVINSEQVFNASYVRSEYVGYMYTENQQHGNTTSSSIKGTIDTWYSTNLASYANYISTETGFCGDREVASGYTWSSSGSTIYYAAHERLDSDSKTPTLKCSNKLDLYTLSSSSKGNKSLTYPIGLITADEAVMAGSGSDGPMGNGGYYLYNGVGRGYWTMTPYSYQSGYANVYLIHHSYGGFVLGYVHVGVSPVINLRADTTFTGTGTSSDPYTVVYN